MSTIHSNTPRDALFRLENMVLMGSVHLPLRAIRAQISGAINLLVHVDRMRDGVRRVTHIVEIVGMEGDVITMQDVFNFKQTGENRDGSLAGKFEMAGFRPHCVDRAAAFGLERQLLESVAAVVQA
jgi:pilus assembly protein CpaF